MFAVTTALTRGEIDPAIIDRQDQKFYENAARRMVNWWADTSGQIFTRPAIETILVEGKEDWDPGTPTTWKLRYLFPCIVRLVEYLCVFDWYSAPALSIPSLVRIRVMHGSTVIQDAFLQPEPYGQVSASVVPDDMAQVISAAQAGNTVFFTSEFFRPQQLVFNADGTVTLAEPIFYAQLFGTLSPTSGGTSWTGVDTILQDQLSGGVKFLFSGKLYTVATVTSQTAMTTVETFTGSAIKDRAARQLLGSMGPFYTAGTRPRLVAFAAGRLIFLTSAAKPTAIWASQINQPFIIIPAGTENDAPINAEYLADGLDSFVWVQSASRIIAGSSQGEYSIGESNSSALVPSAAGILRVGTTGGAQGGATTTGDMTLFTNSSRTQVMATVYDYYRQANTTDDISFLSSHLLAPRVKQLCLRPATGSDRTPRLLAVCEDGSLVTCGFSQNNNVVAWAPMDLGSDMVTHAVAASKLTAFVSSDRGDFVMLGRFGSAASGGFSLDYSQAYAAAPIVQLQSWQFAQVLGVYSDTLGFLGYYTPDSLGRVDLSGVMGLTGGLSIGRTFSATLQLMPAAIADPEGARINRVRRVVRVMVDVLDTALLYVNGTQIIGNAANPEGTDVSPRSGVFTLRTLGWGAQDVTEISTPAGFPAILRSIVREVK